MRILRYSKQLALYFYVKLSCHTLCLGLSVSDQERVSALVTDCTLCCVSGLEVQVWTDLCHFVMIIKVLLSRSEG
jgi:hypothetical protein